QCIRPRDEKDIGLPASRPCGCSLATIGGRIDRWDNGRPAHWEQVRLIEALKLERSSRYLCLEAFITFISKPHDDAGSNFCALQAISASWPPAVQRPPVICQYYLAAARPSRL